MMETVIHLPDETGDALAEEAARSGCQTDDLILEALRHFLAYRKRAVPRSFGLHADPELSGADAEDRLWEHQRLA